MNKETIKKAVESAEQELKDKQVEKLKGVVKDTLQKIKDLDDKIKALEDERKILKLDIDDLKAGRLDLIEERQKVDEKARKVSVIIVEREVPRRYNDPWYQPYVIHYVPYYPPAHNFPITYGNSQSAVIGLALGASTVSDDSVFCLNNSIAKNHTSGTYAVGDKTVYLT